MVMLGDRTPDAEPARLRRHLLYTAFHFIVFALGRHGPRGAGALGHRQSGRALRPAARCSSCSRVLFYGFLEIFSERTHELFPFWAVISANTLAAVCMAAYLWRRHPAFRESIHDTPLGAAPR